MPRTTTLELHKDEYTFSAGHFTIFSATEREDLHGHNYSVSAVMEMELPETGLACDYRFYKNILQKLCQQLDRRFLLPQHSPYLTLEETDTLWLAHFNQEKIPFLKRDIVILPITNVTIEELSHWFLQQILQNTDALKKHGIFALSIRVFNGPGQSGAAHWSLSDDRTHYTKEIFVKENAS